jgi:hypothetical protein
METSVAHSPLIRCTIERRLSERFGTRVRIAGVEAFPHYPQVARCTLEASGGAAPPTLIVRLARSPQDDPTRSGVARLCNEQAALEFLRSIGSALAPRFIASDAAAGILIAEDLGTHPSLLDLLLGRDEAAARQGLLAFARGLGTLHAQTAGRASEYGERRVRLGPRDPETVDVMAPGRVTAYWQRVQDAVVEFGLPRPIQVNDDVEQVVRTLSAPGAYLALSSGDPSPVNCQVADGAVRFFDFEAAGFRHAFVDATVLRYLYPTGGPMWRLPEEVADATERAYREALTRGCPDALDDATYERGMAAACAAWTILRMVRLPRVEAGPDRDVWPLVPPGWAGPLPTRSRRRQLAAILETCIASARGAGALAALATWCERVAGALRERWPEAMEELPLYPAFAWQVPAGAPDATVTPAEGT